MDPFRIVHQRSGSYPIWLGHGLLAQLGDLLESLESPGGIALLVAEGLPRIWIDTLTNGLGTSLHSISFPDSETSKTLSNAERIVGALIATGANRDWIAIVAGGGSAGDTGGFAASIFMRGIRYVHVPTTLLAQVDSSIGGKLGVNHLAGKNLIGVFCPPSAVVADLDTLSTLPPHELRSGLYEALKAGVIADRELFELMETRRESILSGGEEMDEVVARSIDVKIAIVSDDEREEDRRRLLNYGHTIGHGFEAATRYSVLTHGDAVAWGMLAANAVARDRNIITTDARERIDRAILSYRPQPLPPIDHAEVMAAISHDKKFKREKLVMVLPVGIGSCEVFEDIAREEIERGMRAALDMSGRLTL